jgi:tetratricopeptide (TPR) repeat protein
MWIKTLLAAVLLSQSAAGQSQSDQRLWHADIIQLSEDINDLNAELAKKVLERKALWELVELNPDSADRKARELLTLDPEAPQAHHLIADAQFQKGNMAWALGEYTLAIAKWWQWLEKHAHKFEQEQGARQLAVLYGSRGAASMSLHQWQEALADLDQALALKTPVRDAILREKNWILGRKNEKDENRLSDRRPSGSRAPSGPSGPTRGQSLINALSLAEGKFNPRP